MLKGQDIVVLLAAAVRDHDPSWAGRDVRSLGRAIGFDAAGTSRSLGRLVDAELLDSVTRTVRRSLAEEFLVHGVRFVFPARLGEETRGLPTLWGAAPLLGRIASDGLAPVWPDPLGEARGPGFEPLHRTALSAARAHARVYEGLVLVDALRGGTARERNLSQQLLAGWLSGAP